MIFEQIEVGEMANFAYLIGDEDTKEAAIVDPAWDADLLMATAEKHGLKISKILITHTDYDHVNAVGDIIARTRAHVYVHKDGFDEIAKFGATTPEAINEESVILIGNVKVKVIHTPGHRPSNVCFIVENKIITGDTLFVEGCGRIDLPGSDIKKQWDSLVKLKNLDENLEVYPGHDYGSMKSSTIRHEKENNPFMKCTSFEEFSGIR